MAHKDLIKFIKEARKRGFDDYQIRAPLLKHGWPLEDVENAFDAIKDEFKVKQRVTLYLDSELLRRIEKRAEKNLFTLTEQIEDILRRSVLTTKKGTIDNVDDKFLSFFSRRNNSRKK